MLAHLMLVVVASSAVHTRHVNVGSSDGHADQFVQNQSRDLNAYGQLQGYVRNTEQGPAPKTNLNRPHNIQQVDDARYINERSQNLRINPIQGHERTSDFNIQGGKASQFGNMVLDNELDKRDPAADRNNRINYTEQRTDNEQLSNAQGQGHEVRGDRNMYDSAKHESTQRNENKRNKSTVNLQDRLNDDTDAPVTERKPFTNAPRRTEDVNKMDDGDVWIWSDKDVTTMKNNNTDLEDRAAFTGDNCPTGKAKIAGSNMCVDTH